MAKLDTIEGVSLKNKDSFLRNIDNWCSVICILTRLPTIMVPAASKPDTQLVNWSIIKRTERMMCSVWTSLRVHCPQLQTEPPKTFLGKISGHYTLQPEDISHELI